MMNNKSSDVIYNIRECMRDDRQLAPAQNLRNSGISKRGLLSKFSFVDSLSIEQEYGLYARDIITLAFQQVTTQNCMNFQTSQSSLPEYNLSNNSYQNSQSQDPKNQEIHDHLNSTLKSIMASTEHRTLDLSSKQKKLFHALQPTVNENIQSMSGQNLQFSNKTTNPRFLPASFVHVNNSLDLTKQWDKNEKSNKINMLSNLLPSSYQPQRDLQQYPTHINILPQAMSFQNVSRNFTGPMRREHEKIILSSNESSRDQQQGKSINQKVLDQEEIFNRSVREDSQFKVLGKRKRQSTSKSDTISSGEAAQMANKFITPKNILSDTSCMTSDSKQLSKKMTKTSAAHHLQASDISKVIIHYNHLTEQSIGHQRAELISILSNARSGSQVIIKARPKVHLNDVPNAEERNPEDFRGSMYRGVSKNKMKWQMMIMGNQKKIYIGAVESEIEAAAIYDNISILIHGKKAKTNFSYTKQQVEDILSHPSTAILDYQIKSIDKDIINLQQIIVPSLFNKYNAVETQGIKILNSKTSSAIQKPNVPQEH